MPLMDLFAINDLVGNMGLPFDLTEVVIQVLDSGLLVMKTSCAGSHLQMLLKYLKTH